MSSAAAATSPGGPATAPSSSSLTPASVYKLGKAGRWDEVRAAFDADSSLARHAVRFVAPSSQWTLAHQAAYWGNEDAARLCIRYGADLLRRASDSRKEADRGTPADVARARSHSALADLLSSGPAVQKSLWAPVADPASWPASSHFSSAQPRIAREAMQVAYAGGTADLAKGQRCYVDAFERVLVGWHGSTNPPGDMDGDSTLPAGVEHGSTGK